MYEVLLLLPAKNSFLFPVCAFCLLSLWPDNLHLSLLVLSHSSISLFIPSSLGVSIHPEWWSWSDLPYPFKVGVHAHTKAHTTDFLFATHLPDSMLLFSGSKLTGQMDRWPISLWSSLTYNKRHKHWTYSHRACSRTWISVQNTIFFPILLTRSLSVSLCTALTVL